MKLKRLLFSTLIIALAALIVAISVFAEGTVSEGVCGESAVTYKITSDNSLRIEGTGAMPDYKDTERPWDSYATSILSLYIAETVTEIGSDAFVNINVCVTIPSSVTRIGDHAIGYTLNGDEYTLISGFKITGAPESEAERYANENGITFISNVASDITGAYGTGLSYTLTADGVLTIKGVGDMEDHSDGNPAPWKSYSSGTGNYIIKKLVIEDGITHIGNYAFAGCYELKEVVLPDSLQSIGNYAFSACSSLDTISFGSKLSQIGERAFQLTALKSISLPKTVLSFGEAIFYSCEGLKSADISSYKVPTKAFAECTALEKVTLQNGVTEIDGSAFEGCSLLNSISFAKTVRRIADRAFYGCASLSSLILPDGISSYGTYSFAGCSLLENFIFNDSITAVPEGMFYNCSSLSNVTIGDSTTSIGDYTFVGCTSLRSVFISYKVKSIGSYAIGYEYIGGEYALISKFTPNIEGFTPSISRNYAEDNKLTFTNYKTVDTDTGDLTDDIVWRFRPSTGVLNIIGTGAMPDFPTFENTPWAVYKEYIKQVTISSGITNVGSSSFEGCYGVEKIDIPGTVTVIGTSAFAGTSIITAVIPSGVREIANSAFEGCTMLYNVSLPSTLLSVGEAAFKGPNSIITVLLPQSITFIGDMAFGYTSTGTIADGFIMKGFDGSLAASYAASNGISFIINGYQELVDASSGCLISIPESTYSDIKLSFVKLANNLEPNVILASNQTAILYRLQILCEDKAIDVTGPISFSIPIPDGMEEYIVNIYAMNESGQFVSINFEKVGNKFNFSYDTLGQFVITTADLSKLHTITISYNYEDGSTAAATKYVKIAAGAKYRFTAPEIEGYTPDSSSLTGIAEDANLTLEFIYSKNSSLTLVVSETENTGNEKGVSDPKIVLIVIVILLMIALIAAIILLMYLKRKREMQAKETNKTMAAAAKKQNDGDILAKTMVVPDFATREIDIESLFADDPEEDIDAENTFKNSSKPNNE